MRLRQWAAVIVNPTRAIGRAVIAADMAPHDRSVAGSRVSQPS
jgi:hypothetical protein